MKSQIITLCGSARFEREFHLWNKVLTLSGHTVFSLGCFPSIAGGKDWCSLFRQAEGQLHSDPLKKRLDMVHKLKIQRSDAILVLNRNGYVSESTLSEVYFARLVGCDLYAIETWDANAERPGLMLSTTSWPNALNLLPPPSSGTLHHQLIAMLKGPPTAESFGPSSDDMGDIDADDMGDIDANDMGDIDADDILRLKEDAEFIRQFLMNDVPEPKTPADHCAHMRMAAVARRLEGL